MNRAALRVLDTLDRWDERFSEHYKTQRSYERKAYRGQIRVVVPRPSENPSETLRSQTFVAWGRNVSRSGLSFIHPEEIKEKRILIALDTHSAEPTWFHGEIVRARVVQEEFWEYGVRFLGRAVT